MKPVKFPRKPKRIDLYMDVVQKWDPILKIWRDVFYKPGYWPGETVRKLRKPGEYTRIVTRKGKVTESVEAFVSDKGGHENSPNYG